MWGCAVVDGVRDQTARSGPVKPRRKPRCSRPPPGKTSSTPPSLRDKRLPSPSPRHVFSLSFMRSIIRAVKSTFPFCIAAAGIAGAIVTIISCFLKMFGGVTWHYRGSDLEASNTIYCPPGQTREVVFTTLANRQAGYSSFTAPDWATLDLEPVRFVGRGRSVHSQPAFDQTLHVRVSPDVPLGTMGTISGLQNGKRRELQIAASPHLPGRELLVFLRIFGIALLIVFVPLQWFNISWEISDKKRTQ